MQLTQTAEWTHPTETVDRLEIAGYTATVEVFTVKGALGFPDFPAYSYTVLTRGGFEVVETGKRLDRATALGRAELVITRHAWGGVTA